MTIRSERITLKMRMTPVLTKPYVDPVESRKPKPEPTMSEQIAELRRGVEEARRMMTEVQKYTEGQTPAALTKTEAEQIREGLDGLEESFDVSAKALEANGRSLSKIYSTYDQARTDLLAGRVSAAAGSLAILQAAQAELSN